MLVNMTTNYQYMIIDTITVIVMAHLVEESSEHLQVIAHVNASIDPQQLILILSHGLLKSFTLNNQVLVLLLPASQ